MNCCVAKEHLCCLNVHLFTTTRYINNIKEENRREIKLDSNVHLFCFGPEIFLGIFGLKNQNCVFLTMICDVCKTKWV